MVGLGSVKGFTALERENIRFCVLLLSNVLRNSLGNNLSNEYKIIIKKNFHSITNKFSTFEVVCLEI